MVTSLRSASGLITSISDRSCTSAGQSPFAMCKIEASRENWCFFSMRQSSPKSRKLVCKNRSSTQWESEIELHYQPNHISPLPVYPLKTCQSQNNCSRCIQKYKDDTQFVLKEYIASFQHVDPHAEGQFLKAEWVMLLLLYWPSPQEGSPNRLATNTIYWEWEAIHKINKP